MKSFQKVVQIKLDIAISITGSGSLEPNINWATKYLKYLKSELYIISLKQKQYKRLTGS